MVPVRAPKRMNPANWAAREVDHLFSRFARYTRFVVYSKWFLGLFALALLASLIGWPLLTKDRSGLRVSFVDNRAKVTAKAASPVMRSPEYRSTNKTGDQYKIAGVRAVQLTPTLASIERVEAQLLRKSGGWLSLTSDKAEYQQDSKILELMGGVTVIDDRGYSFLTERATMDTKTNATQGNAVISGTGPLGNLLASGFQIGDKGKHIIFTSSPQQRVELHIDRPQKKR